MFTWIFPWVWIFWLFIILFILYIITQLRIVVPTNEVHIVQRKRASVPYGRGFDGNVYIAWPSFLPFIWVEVQRLPLSIFTIKVDQYKAYDSWKVPFIVDVTAFFVVKEPEIAAQKISNIDELKEHLNETLKWVIRKTLAWKDIIEIMESRVEIKEEFYKEVLDSVKSWWVDLKNVEFMDIRDPDDWASRVIDNIMNKKRSQIEAESQIEVAENQKRATIEKENKAAEARARAAEAKSKADIVEYNSIRESELKRIENEKITKQQEIEKERELSLRREESTQKLSEATKLTRERELAIQKLEQEENAEIHKRIEIIKAEEERERVRIDAEAKKVRIELETKAENDRMTSSAEAKKIAIELEAQAEKNRIQQIAEARAREVNYIWTAEARNKTEMAEALNMFTTASLNYMIKELEAWVTRDVDLEKARALSKADIKVISTWENWWNWVKNFMDLFSANWWANVWAMLETFKKTIWEEKFNTILSSIKKDVDLDNNCLDVEKTSRLKDAEKTDENLNAHSDEKTSKDKVYVIKKWWKDK